MTTLKFVQTRPTTAVEFYRYPESYKNLIQSKHPFVLSRSLSANGLVATTELVFETTAQANAFVADSDRASQLEAAKNYNSANGITAVVTRLD